MKHTLCILVMNNPGILARTAGLFARRGYNIESLVVCETERPDVSRMTVVAEGDEIIIEQVVKQLNKLIDVVKVWDITGSAISSELALIKVKCPVGSRQELISLCEVYNAQIAEMSPEAIIIRMADSSGKITEFVELLRQYGLMELARTGELALERGGEGRMKL